MPQSWIGGEHACGRAGAEPAAVVQEEHGEADDAHLRRDDERAARGERPDAAVAQRRGPRVHAVVVGSSLPQHETADDRRGEAGRAERAERPGMPRACSIGGMRIETAKPPIGIAVWRMPSARPRWVAGNHDMTARPLEE